jgi:integrase
MPRRSHGTGSLYVRADSAGRESWYGKWRTDGTQVKRRIGVKRTPGDRDGLTRVQAEAELRRLIAETIPAKITPGDALTIAELGRRYIANLERQGRKKSTKVAVESVLRVWFEPFFGDRDLRKIQVADVNDLMRMMEQGKRPGPRAKGDRRYGKPVGAKSIRNYVITLSALLGYAERKGWLATNVAHRVDLPAVERNEDIRYLEADDIAVLVDRVPAGPFQQIDQAMYMTAAMTGLRVGELVALRWRDVDWVAGRVRVRQNYVLGEFGTPKSRRSTRSVPMNDEVAGALDRLAKRTAKAGDDDLVFTDPLTFSVLDKAAVLRRFKKALKAAQLDQTHVFHDLRHTFGTRCAAAGVPMRTLQEWMGHRDLETTQRYADYAPSADEAAMIARAFSRPSGHRETMAA